MNENTPETPITPVHTEELVEIIKEEIAEGTPVLVFGSDVHADEV